MGKNLSIFLVVLFSMGMIMGSALSVQAAPTDGFTQMSWDSSSYYVQNRTNAPLEQRFWIADGIYTTCVYAGEERVEMRWNTWPNQKLEHMFDADVMYEPGTNHTCIMQVKSNSSGEAMYMQVYTNGDLRNSVGTPFLRNYAGKWFNLKVSYNPTTGVGRAWVNDVLMVTASHRNTSDWYFKCGTYNNGITSGGKSEVHFKNIKFWIAGTSQTTPTPGPTPKLTPTPSQTPTPVVSNLALNKSVTCSSAQTGNEASHMVDGDATNTRWSASPYPQWARIDLGSVHSLNRTELVPYSNRAYRYKIEVSTDGNTYTQVINRTSNTTGSSLLTDTFPAINARYVRLTVTGCYNYTGTWISINEFRVYGN